MLWGRANAQKPGSLQAARLLAEPCAASIPCCRVSARALVSRALGPSPRLGWQSRPLQMHVFCVQLGWPPATCSCRVLAVWLVRLRGNLHASDLFKQSSQVGSTGLDSSEVHLRCSGSEGFRFWVAG